MHDELTTEYFSLRKMKSSRYGWLYIKKRYYESGRPALQLVDHAAKLIAVLTVNIPEHDGMLAPGEFFVKTWSENELLAKEALASGNFADTGRRVPTGHVEAQIWKFSEKEG